MKWEGSAKDKALDKAKGIKEGSKADIKMDTEGKKRMAAKALRSPRGSVSASGSVPSGASAAVGS